MLLQISRYVQAFPQTFNSLSQVWRSTYSCLIHLLNYQRPILPAPYLISAGPKGIIPPGLRGKRFP